MINVSMDELLKKVECRYTLVIEVAKRARQIVDNSDRYSLEASNKPVSTAIYEINTGDVVYRNAVGNGDD